MRRHIGASRRNIEHQIAQADPAAPAAAQQAST
jgi:hypothetical protein